MIVNWSVLIIRISPFLDFTVSGIYIFIIVVLCIEISLKKKYRPCSDASICGVWTVPICICPVKGFLVWTGLSLFSEAYLSLYDDTSLYFGSHYLHQPLMIILHFIWCHLIFLLCFISLWLAEETESHSISTHISFRSIKIYRKKPQMAVFDISLMILMVRYCLIVSIKTSIQQKSW